MENGLDGNNDYIVRQPIIRRFAIRGLYGYKTIALDTPNSAAILIAGNGSGKTTLLAALDAFLKRQFVRLRDLSFEEIFCQIQSLESELVLRKSDLDQIVKASDSDAFTLAARRVGIEPTDLFNFLEGDFVSLATTRKDYHENKIFSSILSFKQYSSKDAFEFCEDIRRSYYCATDHLTHLWNSLEGLSREVEVVYLPTYRRVEFPAADEDARVRSARRRRSTVRLNALGLNYGDINFGLTDVSDKLQDLNTSILIESNISYRQISADIIDDLISGHFDASQYQNEEIPNVSEIRLFLSRLKDVGQRIGPFSEPSIPNLDAIYETAERPRETSKFLLYFLGKLGTAMGATKRVEALVEEFISVCNKYLSSQDPSVSRSEDGHSSRAIDGKSLKLNRRDLSVHVETFPQGRTISLDSLSSGEKQMISLFSKVYLSEKKQLILIDEPELSLSIGWQREILPDILRSPSCEQVVAITHSPFIFDNELERFAGPLYLSVDTLDPEQVADNSTDGN